MDPPGFALESFDVMGGWRDRYRGVDESLTSEKGLGKNGQPFAFHYALPVDATGVLPDGRQFTGIRGLKRLLFAERSQPCSTVPQSGRLRYLEWWAQTRRHTESPSLRDLPRET